MGYFAELMQKLTSLFDGDLVLKYQLIPEDLDALVSVKTDEDLRHMLDEHERQEGEGTPRLRAFLFPSTPIILDLQIASASASAAAAADSYPIEQRYIDAINGVVRIPPPSPRIIPPKPSITTSFTISSACTSPQSLSPDHFSHDPTTTMMTAGHESPAPRAVIHKVRSSPTLYSLNQPTTAAAAAADAHPASVTPLVYQHQHQHLYHQNYQQYHHPAIQCTRLPQDPGKGATATATVTGTRPSSYYSSVRQHKGFGSSNRYVHSEEGSPRGGKRVDRAESIPRATWE